MKGQNTEIIHEELVTHSSKPLLLLLLGKKSHNLLSCRTWYKKLVYPDFWGLLSWKIQHRKRKQMIPLLMIVTVTLIRALLNPIRESYLSGLGNGYECHDVLLGLPGLSFTSLLSLSFRHRESLSYAFSGPLDFFSLSVFCHMAACPSCSSL